MKRFLLGTNILLQALRNDSFWQDISLKFKFSQAQNYISVVSLGELYALSLKNNWGTPRKA